MSELNRPVSMFHDPCEQDPMREPFFLPQLPQSLWPHSGRQLPGGKLPGQSVGLISPMFCFVLFSLYFSF